jgi:hypothetical protein
MLEVKTVRWEGHFVGDMAAVQRSKIQRKAT